MIATVTKAFRKCSIYLGLFLFGVSGLEICLFCSSSNFDFLLSRISCASFFFESDDGVPILRRRPQGEATATGVDFPEFGVPNISDMFGCKLENQKK